MPRILRWRLVRQRAAWPLLLELLLLRGDLVPRGPTPRKHGRLSHIIRWWRCWPKRIFSCMAGCAAASAGHPAASEEIWGDYNRRAGMKNRIAELKNDLAADNFCSHEFFATEAALHGILLLFDLLGEFQRAIRLTTYRQSATLRSPVFLGGTRRVGRLVLHVSSSWEDLQQRIPLLESILAYGVSTSPKLYPEAGTRTQNRSRKPLETAYNFGIRAELRSLFSGCDTAAGLPAVCGSTYLVPRPRPT